MDADSLKYIAIGLMSFGMLGAAFGVANIFSSLLNAIARNPAQENKLFARAIIGAAMAEAMGIFALGVALILLFK
ncbi:MAG: F0F1 ATP synthase subunit C [Rickettsiales bacterium]|jgi:F-type H+-transporting ATPase subunit c|nr:F0F1 ATP synthase subunit C [Rickettsiales bacterium]